MKYLKEYKNIDWEDWDDEEFESNNHILRKERIMTKNKNEATYIMEYLESLGENINIRSINFYGNGLAYFHHRWTYVGLSTNPSLTKNFIDFDELKKRYKL